MFTLRVNRMNLENHSVVLVKSTAQGVSVICGLWAATGGLPTCVSIGALYAYASTSEAELQDCVTISANIRSSPISEGNIYQFDGATFVQGGQTPPDLAYGLSNKGKILLTCGLCQDVAVNGVPATPPVCVESLPPGNTAFFPTNNQFWLGVVQFSGLSDPQPGFLLSTSIIQSNLVLEAPAPCELVVGPFAQVDFSVSRPNWVAAYQPASSSFLIRPGLPCP